MLQTSFFFFNFSYLGNLFINISVKYSWCVFSKVPTQLTSNYFMSFLQNISSINFICCGTLLGFKRLLVKLTQPCTEYTLQNKSHSKIEKKRRLKTQGRDVVCDLRSGVWKVCSQNAHKCSDLILNRFFLKTLPGLERTSELIPRVIVTLTMFTAILQSLPFPVSVLLEGALQNQCSKKWWAGYI